jgi:putative glutamine amidotransferase
VASDPVIAITCGSAPKAAEELSLYCEAVERCGGSALLAVPEAGVAEVAVHCDGLLIPGGKDLDPSVYGERPLESVNREGPERSAFEFSLLHEIMRACKPVLGICYGMQLINVYFGGTLYQDIPTQMVDALDHRSGVHSVTVSTNPFIESGVYEVNSSHHQAVHKAGRGIVPFARSSDGVVEAFYVIPYPFLVGLQWHPERMTATLSKVVFDRFIEACRDGE